MAKETRRQDYENNRLNHSEIEPDISLRERLYGQTARLSDIIKRGLGIAYIVATIPTGVLVGKKVYELTGNPVRIENWGYSLNTKREDPNISHSNRLKRDANSLTNKPVIKLKDLLCFS